MQLIWRFSEFTSRASEEQKSQKSNLASKSSNAPKSLYLPRLEFCICSFITVQKLVRLCHILKSSRSYAWWFFSGILFKTKIKWKSLIEGPEVVCFPPSSSFLSHRGFERLSWFPYSIMASNLALLQEFWLVILRCRQKNIYISSKHPGRFPLDNSVIQNALRILFQSDPLSLAPL